jgi:hypothetical protein
VDNGAGSRWARRLRIGAPGALVLLSALALGLPAAIAAQPQSLVASSGDVAATLSYETTPGEPGGVTYSGEHLQISQGGTTYYDAPIHSSACSSECALEAGSGGALTLAELEGDGHPDVILRLNSGGAHCCTIVQVFSFDPGVTAFRETERDFGDPGAALRDLAGDGRLEFLSGDDRFAYEFAPYAYSPLPPQIWQVRDGRFLDVTRSFPEQLTADASKQFRLFLFNRRLGLGLGCLAAWAADEELLGHAGAVTAMLARELHRHNLRSRESLDPGGSAFVKKLEGFLKKTGYISR